MVRKFTFQFLFLSFSFSLTKQENKIDILTSHRNLTFLGPITTASMISIILCDSLCLTTNELVTSISEECAEPSLYDKEGGSVDSGLDTGLGGERPCSFLARTKTVTVVLGSRFRIVYVSVKTSLMVIQCEGFFRV